MSENNSTSNPKKKILPFKKKSPPKSPSNDYIDERLRSIYKGEDGKIPNMKKIEIKKSSFLLRGLLVFLLLGTVLSMVAWVKFLNTPHSKDSADTYLSLKLSGPDSVAFGTTSTYVISYKNLKKYNLNSTQIDVRYPAGFIFTSSSLPSKNTSHTQFSLGTIRPSQEGDITISGLLYGETNEEKSLRVTTNFQSEDSSATLTKSISLKSQMTESPFNVTLTTKKPTDSTQISQVNVVVIKKNSAPFPYKMELSMNVPANFLTASATPQFSRGNTWTINPEMFKNSNTLNFSFQGNFNENSATSLAFQANLNLILNSQAQKILIAKTNLGSKINDQIITQNSSDQNIKLRINNSENNLDSSPGDLLSVEIPLNNTTEESWIDGEVKISFEAPSYNKQSIFNWNQVKDDADGDLKGEQVADSIRKATLAWNAKNIPYLKKVDPGSKNVITFSVPLKTKELFDFTKINNSTIKATVTVSYKTNTGVQKNFSSGSVNINLGSDISFEARGAKSNSDNGGDYQISWILNKNDHSLKNILINSTLPKELTWVPPSSVPAGSVNYDETSRQITWAIKEMPESLDVLALQFSLNLNSVSTPDSLLSETRITANDAVTGKQINQTNKSIPFIR
jgi:hypothetical protein